jgi:nicotinamidase-related amidase
MKDEFNERSGFTGAFKLGRRPALVVVDFQKGFTQPDISPLASECDGVLSATAKLMSAFRSYGPVFLTVTGYSDHLIEAGVWIQKCVSLETLKLGTAACEIDDLLDIQKDRDTIIYKTQASAFFGTPLSGLLATYGCDSLLVAGCTTSGCVRATVVDAVAHGYPAFVARDCVSDRSQNQHDSNLVDMQSKYAEVMASAELLDGLSRSRIP